jgi:hypothetical protein
VVLLASLGAACTNPRDEVAVADAMLLPASLDAAVAPPSVPRPDGGAAAVDGPPPIAMCAAGSRRCGAECQPVDSPGACGASCAKCPAPAGADATCTGGTCGYTCRDVATRKCDGGCFECCAPADCPARAGHIPQCGRHVCEYLCAEVTCGDRCVPLTGACEARLDPRGGGTTCSASLCSEPVYACDAPALVRWVLEPVNTLAELQTACAAEFPRLGQELCATPEARRAVAAGLSLSVSFLVSEFWESTGNFRTFQGASSIDGYPCR